MLTIPCDVKSWARKADREQTTHRIRPSLSHSSQFSKRRRAWSAAIADLSREERLGSVGKVMDIRTDDRGSKCRALAREEVTEDATVWLVDGRVEATGSVKQ
eukprot:27799-Eustigmatos_ZCMA.PRE.1